MDIDTAIQRIGEILDLPTAPSVDQASHLADVLSDHSGPSPSGPALPTTGGTGPSGGHPVGRLSGTERRR